MDPTDPVITHGGSGGLGAAIVGLLFRFLGNKRESENAKAIGQLEKDVAVLRSQLDTARTEIDALRKLKHEVSNFETIARFSAEQVEDLCARLQKLEDDTRGALIR